MRKQYISSMKGIACFFVALGHFLGTIKYASAISVNKGFFLWLEKYRLDFLLNEKFWLYLFFVVSGYLVANSKVTTFSQAVVRSTTRFLRLAIPIFAACVFIFVLNKAVPFYSADTKSLFENDWLQSAYTTDFSIGHLLLSPFDVLFLQKTVFNSPYWVLRSMMLASLVIYVLTYVRHKDVLRKFFAPTLLLMAAGAFYLDKVVSVCLLGSFLCYYEIPLQKRMESKALLITSGCLSLALCFWHDIFGGIALFSWLILALPKLAVAKRFLENKVFRFFGEMSFGIYSFHWPVFCSVGSLVIIKLWDIIGGAYAIFLSIVISVVITTLVSVLFYYTVEKTSGRFIGKFRNRFELLLSKSPSTKK